MVNVLDVAAYVLKLQGGMTTWKLQKLVYYCQAWSIVWDDDQIFPEEIRAWANGPVVRELYDEHKGQFRIGTLRKGDPDKLSALQRETVEIVVDYYGRKSGQWLSDLTHMENPWKEARRGISDQIRGDRIISKESLGEYYGSLE